MLHPIYITKSDTGYLAVSPDLIDCKAVARNIEDVVSNMTTAIVSRLEKMIEECRAIPVPQPVEYYLPRPEFNTPGASWVLVEIDLSKLTMKPKRINISLPERLLKVFDNFADKKGLTRSGFLTQAANDYINREMSKSIA